MERKTNTQITRVKTGNTTNTQITSTTSYERSLSWGSFKIIFLACLLTIFSCIFFVGDMPTGFKNSIIQDVIQVPAGQTITIESLNTSNLHLAKLKLNTNNKYVSFHQLTDNIPNKGTTRNTYVSTGGNQSSFTTSFGTMTSRYNSTGTTIYNSTLYYQINEECYYNYGNPVYRLYIGYYINSSNYSSGLQLFLYNSNGYQFSNYGYDFILNFNSDFFNYLNGIDENIFLNWVKSNFILINADELNTYYEYSLSYSDYNWTDIKIRQLSYFKNIFEPLFNQENQDITNNISLNNGFDYLETLIAKGIISYIGDKTTPNKSWGDNWFISDDITITQQFKLVKFMSSNVGYFINSNYYYDDITNSFVRYNTNQLFGSLENDNNTSWQNVLNVLSYPLTTSYNILYNTGVFFTFVFYW